MSGTIAKLSCSAFGQVPAEVRWAAGAEVQALWLAAGRLLLDRHAWVRRAAGRLLGAAFADAKIGAFCQNGVGSALQRTASRPEEWV